jgi:hypothetical protein
MNKYIKIGSITIALGTLLMTQLIGDQKLMIVIGAIINALGLYLMTKGSIISGTEDKKEIINIISGFREEIKIMKNEISNEDSLDKLIKIENEFDEWAESFTSNIEIKKIEQQKIDTILREKEIILSKDWKHIYQYFFETIKLMVEAYNQRVKNKIELIMPPLPNNLYGNEAELFRTMIVFSENIIWTITLFISKPYERDKIPDIKIKYLFGEHGMSAREMAEKDSSTWSYLMLIFHLKDNSILLGKGDQNQYFGDLKDSYSINSDNYKTSIKELITTLFEYQIINLPN